MITKNDKDKLDLPKNPSQEGFAILDFDPIRQLKITKRKQLKVDKSFFLYIACT